MISMHATRPTRAPMGPTRLAEPPPAAGAGPAGEVVGWARHDAIGFHGFADETEAAQAAWIARRAVERRLARRTRRQAPPLVAEPLAIARRGAEHVILACGQPIATLRRPADDGRRSRAFGIELPLPPPADERRARALAHVAFLALRASGLPWASLARLRRSPATPAGPAAAAGHAPSLGDRMALAIGRAGAAGAVVLLVGLLLAASLGAATAPVMVATAFAVAAMLAPAAVAAIAGLAQAGAGPWTGGRRWSRSFTRGAPRTLHRSPLTASPGALGSRS